MNRRSPSAEALNSTETETSPRARSQTTDRWWIICFIIAVLNILMGSWMLIAPKHWFYNLPANVPAFGPLNYHFVRDLGAVFFLLGLALLHAAYHVIYRIPLFTANTAFYLAHMFVHIFEVVSGRVEMKMFWTDLAGVYVPAVIFAILNILLIKQNPNKRTI